MTPQREKLIVQPDPRYPQQIAPQLPNRRLDPVPRRPIANPLANRPGRRRQRPAIDLPARTNRKRLKPHHHRRHQMTRQHPTQIVPQSGPVPAPHRIANQPIVPRNHRATNHMTARHQSRLNLPRLNPVAPHLHLTVATTDILQHPIRPPTNQISRPVQTAPAAAITIRDKTRRRPTATTQITPGQTNPAQIQLPNNPTRNQLKTTVQNVPNHPRDRTTDRHTARWLARPIVRPHHHAVASMVASVGP